MPRASANCTSSALVFNFIVAYLTASKDKVHDVIHGPFSSDNWGAILDDNAFPFLIISLVFLAFGPGKASLDYLIKRLVFGPQPPRATPPGGFEPVTTQERA